MSPCHFDNKNCVSKLIILSKYSNNLTVQNVYKDNMLMNKML